MVQSQSLPTTNGDDQDLLKKLQARTLSVSAETRSAAIAELVNAVRDGQEKSIVLMTMLDDLLFRRNYTDADRDRYLKRADVPQRIKRAITLYQTMYQLMAVCDPKGNGIGPSCYVKPLDRSRIDLLSQEQRNLEKTAREFFKQHRRSNRPTLQVIACGILKKNGAGYSLRTAARMIDDLKLYTFPDKDLHRDHMIASVNSFSVARVTEERAFNQELVSDVWRIDSLGRAAAAKAITAMVQSGFLDEVNETIKGVMASFATAHRESLYRLALDVQRQAAFAVVQRGVYGIAPQADAVATELSLPKQTAKPGRDKKPALVKSAKK